MQCQSVAACARLGIKAEICLLGEAVTFFLHHCPGFNKESALWAQGLLHLLLLFYFQEGSQASYAESIREKLRCFRWQRFRSQNAVYMKVAVDTTTTTTTTTKKPPPPPRPPRRASFAINPRNEIPQRNNIQMQ